MSSEASPYVIRFRMSDILGGAWVASSIRGILNITGPALSIEPEQNQWQIDEANTMILYRYQPDGYRLRFHSETLDWAQALADHLEDRLEARGVTLS